MLAYPQWRELLGDDMRLPAALVDLDAFDRNVEQLAQITRDGGKQLRLATKSVRVPELIRRVLDYGAPYSGLMCFSCEEAEYLAGEGFDDLLVAYPSLRTSDLLALRRIHDTGTRAYIVVDSLASVQALASAMAGVDTPFPALVDVDASLRHVGGRVHVGVRRSPIRTPGDLGHLLDAAAPYADSVRIAGMMAYEAQVAGLGDRNPFKRTLNPIARVVRSRSVAAVSTQRAQLERVFVERGLELEVFNGGGTGSVTYAAGEPALTELTAGSGLLCSHLFDYYSNVTFEPAAFFALQAVRSSDPGYVTCQGGGYIASGEPGWDKVPVPWLPKGLKLVGTEGCGEVQTPLRVPAGTTIESGDPVLFRHAKAGELAERFDSYWLVSDGKFVGEAATYRGVGRTFY